MKIIKNIFIVLVILAALFVIVGLFLPSKFKVERALVINAPQEQIFEQVNSLKNWSNWSEWNKMDPNMKISYSEMEAGVGAYYSWVSQNTNIGKGKITTTKSEPVDYFEAIMEFEGMKPSTLYTKLEPTEGGIKVIMGMNSDVGSNFITKYFFNLWGDAMVGGNYEKSLSNLEKYLKENPANQELITLPVNNVADSTGAEDTAQ